VNDTTSVKHLEQADWLAPKLRQKRAEKSGRLLTEAEAQVVPVRVVGVPRAQHASSIEHPEAYNLALGEALDLGKAA
jgi:hypothetical protein